VVDAVTVDLSVREAVEAAVRGVAGLPAAVPSAAVPSPADAAAAVVDHLAVAHELDLAAGERDIGERLTARLGPDVLHDPRVLVAIDYVLHADRGAHAAARGVVARGLAEAFAAPAGEREARVNGVLEADRERVKQRAGTRMARAVRGMVAAERLQDSALERGV
jgi:hypothetical protein